jgi:hypothetical protein
MVILPKGLSWNQTPIHYQKKLPLMKRPWRLDKPVTLMLQIGNGFYFLQAVNFQNPSKLQEVLVLFDGL